MAIFSIMVMTIFDICKESTFLKSNCIFLNGEIFSIWLESFSHNSNMKNWKSQNSAKSHLSTKGIKGPHFLFWNSGVVPFNTWFISNWQENNCCYKLSNWHSDKYFKLKMTILSEIDVVLRICSACDNIFLLSLRWVTCCLGQLLKFNTENEDLHIFNFGTD